MILAFSAVVIQGKVVPLAAIVPLVLVSVLLAYTAMFLSKYFFSCDTGKVYDIQSKVPTWCEHTVRIEPDALICRSAVLSSELRWEGITSIAEDELGLFLYFGPLQALFIPRRVFVNAAEAQQFWALAQSYHTHARKLPI